MHAGALRALEFDRIVDAVGRLAQTPPGAGRLAELQPSHEAREVAAALADTAETARFLSGSGEIALRAPAELEADPDSARRRKGAPSSRCSSSDSRPSSPRSTRPPAVSGASAPAFPRLGAVVETAASFERETADVRRKIDPGGRRRRRCQPRAERAARPPAQAAGAAARDARVVPARQGHVEIPAAAGRHRPQRPLRARRPRRIPRRDPGHRPRQLGEAAPACSSSRSAPSRSTTTSSRSSSRSRRRSTASC